jgi:hypothetical protein
LAAERLMGGGDGAVHAHQLGEPEEETGDVQLGVALTPVQ